MSVARTVRVPRKTKSCLKIPRTRDLCLQLTVSVHNMFQIFFFQKTTVNVLTVPSGLTLASAFSVYSTLQQKQLIIGQVPWEKIWTMHSWKKLTFYLILAVAVTTNAAELVDGPFSKLQAKYKSLSPKGKVATGAAVGFIGSRLALTTVASVAKVGAAAFITYVHSSNYVNYSYPNSREWLNPFVWFTLA